MAEKPKNQWITPERRHLGWWRQALEQLRLTWVLLRDNRVPLLHKLIPIVTLAYILSPIDLIPDMFVGLGMLDDLGILMLGISWFNSLAPADVALEHLNRLHGVKTDITVTPEHIEDVTDQGSPTTRDRRTASKRI